MIRTQSFDDKTMDTRSEEDYDFCNAEASKKNYIAKFTPPSDTKVCSKDRFISPRWLSKSVPRRNRNVVRYKINRSLNFDIGHHKNDYFTSPQAKGNNSSRNHLHLSRSAKILKALNIDYNPMKSGGYKKINKTLNFDLTPSPKRFSNANKSQCHLSNLRLASPSGINKTLNFDSSEDSPIADSLHDTSAESIDENQNQTPSHRNSKVKKSLSYMSLSSNSSNTSFDFNLRSPSLRTELREKIDDIVQTSMSPNLQLIRKSPGHGELNGGTMIASTPRNLCNDFSDDDEDRPETPENAIRLIPESMSAIKKSHRKERISGRFAHRIQLHIAKPIKMETAEDEEQRPLTPLTSDTQHTPNHNLRSIKKSHKKDKSRRKLCGYGSEDELSETGSLFDYSTLDDETKNNKSSECNSDEKNTTTAAEIFIQSTNINERIINKATTQIPQAEDIATTTMTTTTTDASPTTPENRIDYLRRIMTDSIKKSHKKLKETNKKSLIKTRILEQQIDIEKIQVSSRDDNELKDDDESPPICVTVTSATPSRSSTPENMNSSRLLLAQFSSVKKSHKKDKHRKLGFAQRHIAITREEENNSGCCSVRQSADKTRNNTSLLTFNIPQINVIDASTSRSTFGTSLSSISSEDKNEFRSLGISPLQTSDDSENKSMASSPNKRKSPQSDENGNAEISSSLSNESHAEYESAEDEFKIFTPIKKRKPLIILSTSRVFDNNNTSVTYPENALSNGRCDTPKIGLHIFTPERKKNFVVSEHDDDDDDNNKCSTQPPINDTENENGRSTPENNGRLERISALSSIKKSHKKDKWANARRRSVRTLKETSANISECDRKVNNCPKNLNASINNWRQSRMHELSSDSGEKTESFDEEINPKPSTSYSDTIIESCSSIKTPPNGLGAKTYLRLIEATSIKRSHKKMRERKRIESIIFDPNLSDDGSIFDETEKSFNSSSEIEHLRSDKKDDNNDDFMPLDDSNGKAIDNEKIHYLNDSHSFGENCSNDGSIYEFDSETNSPRKS